MRDLAVVIPRRTARGCNAAEPETRPVAGDGRPAVGSCFGGSWEGMEAADSAREAAGVSELRGLEAAAPEEPPEDGGNSAEGIPDNTPSGAGK